MMADRKKKLTWKKPQILFELPFEKTAAGNPGGGDDYITFGFSES
jgi:hypothetical protein